MAIRDTWSRALEYFGLVEGDYIEEGEYDEGDTGTDMALDEASSPREPVRSSSRRRAREDDIDDIFGDDEPPTRTRTREDEEPEPAPRRGRRRASRGNGGGVASMHVVTPRSFNDAQQVADEFKRSKPVIINLQSTDRELSKRLIDFSSGMTYALGGERGLRRLSMGTTQDWEVAVEEGAPIIRLGSVLWA